MIIYRLEFIHCKNEMVIGSIGSIVIWNFKKYSKMTRVRNDFNEIKLTIDLDSQEWVNVIHICEVSNTIFAGCDSNLYVTHLIDCKLFNNRHTIILRVKRQCQWLRYMNYPLLQLCTCLQGHTSLLPQRTTLVRFI